MTTLTVNIENEKDLPVLQEILNRFGLEYSVEEGEEDKALEEALNRALADSEAGRVRPHAEVMAEMRARYKL
jgi:predicted transcriptional regulator